MNDDHPVFIVVYSNHFIEEWNIRGVFTTREKADELKDKLEEKKGDVFDLFIVEEWTPDE